MKDRRTNYMEECEKGKDKFPFYLTPIHSLFQSTPNKVRFKCLINFTKSLSQNVVTCFIFIH